MPWITSDAQWTTPPGLGGAFWAFDGDFVKLSPMGATFSYVEHIPRIMNVIAGTAKSGIMIKDNTETEPKPGCHPTDIWDSVSYTHLPLPTTPNV